MIVMEWRAVDFFTVKSVVLLRDDIKGPGVTGVVLALSFLRPGLVGLDSLELLVLLPLPSKCWDYRCEPTCYYFCGVVGEIIGGQGFIQTLGESQGRVKNKT